MNSREKPQTLSASNVEPVTSCPVCNSSVWKVLHDDIEDFYFNSDSAVWTLKECLACRSAYLDPRLTPSSIASAYSTYYTHQSQTIAPLDRLSVQGKQYAINRWVRHDYHSKPLSDLLYPFLRFSEHKRLIREYFRDIPVENRGKKLLDVGCGNGEFLETVRMSGWTAEGVDFDPAAVNECIAKGLRVQLGGIENYSVQSNCFDEITLSHIIEHVFDPRQLIADCFRLLKTGGRLWIETPNISSHGHQLTGRYWRGLESPRHLVLFNPDSLTKLLQDAGFKKTKHLGWRAMFPYLYHMSRMMSESKGVTRKSRLTIGAIKIYCELDNIFRPARREFITIEARKL